VGQGGLALPSLRAAYTSPTLTRLRRDYRQQQPDGVPRESKSSARSTLALDSGCSRCSKIFFESEEDSVTESDSKSGAYEFHTKAAQSGGLETNGGRERILDFSRCAAVWRFSREARDYWASIRARNPAENVGRGRTGGQGVLHAHRARCQDCPKPNIAAAGGACNRACRAVPIVRRQPLWRLRNTAGL
jgi:hypothetical protein